MLKGGVMVRLSVLCLSVLALLMIPPAGAGAGEWTKIDGETLRFEGPIERNDIARFNDLIDDGIRTIIVTSGGGDTLAAIPIAESIQRRQLNIIVDGICASSCADYFFIAAHEKSVPRGSLVLWHGGLGSTLRRSATEMRDTMRRAGMTPEQIDAQFRSWREGAARESALYRRAGVDMALLDYSTEVTENACDFWAPPPGVLKRLGVDHVTSFWYPATEIELHETANSLRNQYYRRFMKNEAPPLRVRGGDIDGQRP